MLWQKTKRSMPSSLRGGCRQPSLLKPPSSPSSPRHHPSSPSPANSRHLIPRLSLCRPPSFTPTVIVLAVPSTVLHPTATRLADHNRFRILPALIADAKKKTVEPPLIKMASPQPASSPRRSRGFSVKSDNSHRSSTSGQKSHKSHKSHLSESSEEKARRSLHTKADPLVAMNELQPSMLLLSSTWTHAVAFLLTGDSGRRPGKVQLGLFAWNAT